MKDESSELSCVCFRSVGAQNMATSFFRTVDLIGQQYLALLIPSLSQLWLLNGDIVEGESPSFGSLTVIHATQAITLTSLSMILVLGQDKQLTLYSGAYKVAMVTSGHTHLMVMDGSTELTGVCGIRDSLGDSFMLTMSSGEMLRCSLPSLCRHPVGRFIMWAFFVQFGIILLKLCMLAYEESVQV